MTNERKSPDGRPQGGGPPTTGGAAEGSAGGSAGRSHSSGRRRNRRRHRQGQGQAQNQGQGQAQGQKQGGRNIHGHGSPAGAVASPVPASVGAPSTPPRPQPHAQAGFASEHDEPQGDAEGPLRLLDRPDDPAVEVQGELLPFAGSPTLPTGLLVQAAHVRVHATGHVAEYEVTGDSVAVGDLVVVETEHGTALGTVTGPVMARKLISASPSLPPATERTSTDRASDKSTRPQGPAPNEGEDASAPPPSRRPVEDPNGAQRVRLRTLLRKADAGDERILARNREREKELLDLAKSLVRERKMPMKIFRSHLAHGSPRVAFYFTADERIDFRELVRELSHRIHLRIELRQVGVRDEAKRTGGIGDCGRELCCTTWLPDFAPVTIKMAKEQNIVLNPARVSGQCGRLKCCLVYEYAQYQEAKRHLPRVGHFVSTPEGEARVAEVQTMTGKIRVQLAAGGTQTFSASELKPSQAAAHSAAAPAQKPPAE